MVVVIIIGLLAGLVLPQFIRQEEKAKLKATQAQIELLGTALDTFRLDVGRYPSTEEGLQALRQKPGTLDRWDGPYLKKDLPQDPWGKPYIYKSPGDHGPYDIVSYGADSVREKRAVSNLRTRSPKSHARKKNRSHSARPSGVRQ